MDKELTSIRNELLQMGITMRYKGFEQTARAVGLALRDPESMTLVSKLIYPDVGKQFGVSWRVVERNIRTVIDVVWESNPAHLSKLAGHSLCRKPKPSDFIAILANAVAKDAQADE